MKDVGFAVAPGSHTLVAVARTEVRPQKQAAQTPRVFKTERLFQKQNP